MRCTRCDTELERPGQAHTCHALVEERIAPPVSWTVFTWVAIGLALLYGVYGAISAVVVAGLLDAEGRVPRADAPVAGLLQLGWLVIVMATWIVSWLWNRRTRRLADSYGLDGRALVRGWYLRVYGLFFLVSVLLALLGLNQHDATLVLGALRVLAGVFLACGLLISSFLVVRAIEDSARQSAEARLPRAPEPPAPTEAELDARWG